MARKRVQYRDTTWLKINRAGLFFFPRRRQAELGEAVQSCFGEVCPRPPATVAILVVFTPSRDWDRQY